MAEPSNGPGQTKPGKFPTGAVVGGVATIATLGVALSQLVLNGLEIREKAAPVAKAAGLEQVAPDPASTENNAPPPGLSRLQAAGEDPAPTEVAEVAAPAAVPYGQGFRYPSGAEAVALPATVDKQLHALFVALESSLRNRAAYADYRVVFLDPRKLRLLRRPVDDVGTRVALGFGSGVPAPELRVNAELWEILQRTDYAAVAVVSFVCPAEPCPEPSLALRGLKNSLEDAGIGVFQGPLGDRETLIATDGGGTVTLPNHALIVTFPEETP